MLRIVNNHPKGIWVAIWYYDPAQMCADGPWMKRGWWRIEPYTGKIVVGGSLKGRNPYYCYYAEADDGVRWEGDYHTQVMDREFNCCLGTVVGNRRDAGFRLLYTKGVDNYTLTLRMQNDPVPID